MSANPSVATSAVLAPRPSSSAFVATVMPWAKPLTSAGAAPAEASTASTAAMTPRDWSAGVVGALAVCRRPEATSTASVNVPPTSTPRSMSAEAIGGARACGGRAVRGTGAAACARDQDPGRSRLGRERLVHLDLLRLCEVLVRRAIAVLVQRDALARCAAARGGAALHRIAVRVEAAARHPIDDRLRDVDIAGDDLPRARLRGHRDVGADVVEERSRRAREVVPVGDEPLDGRLPRAKHALVRLAATDDVPRQLAVDRPAELVHAASFFPGVLLPRARVCAGDVKPKTRDLLSSR